jgi:hypothetical protein
MRGMFIMVSTAPIVPKVADFSLTATAGDPPHIDLSPSDFIGAWQPEVNHGRASSSR